MRIYENIGMSVLSKFLDYYEEAELYDLQYIPVVKVIVNGIRESMLSANLAEKDIEALKERLIEWNRGIYKDLWLEHAKEEEDPARLDLEYEAEEAAYCFDYIYEHGKHPR